MAQLILDLPDELAKRIEVEASALQLSPEARIAEILEGSVAPAENLQANFVAEGVAELSTYVGASSGHHWLINERSI